MESLITYGTASGLLLSQCLQVINHSKSDLKPFLVGFGDITIFVNVSRIVFILAIIWGVLIYSFFIVSMNVLTTLSENEREVYD
jgi:hypothetical protein